MYWGKRYIHVYNVHGFLWHENWLYFTCTLTSVKETIQRISIIIIYIIPWNIFMGFAEHFLKFLGWRPASVVLAKKLRNWGNESTISLKFIYICYFCIFTPSQQLLAILLGTWFTNPASSVVFTETSCPVLLGLIASLMLNTYLWGEKKSYWRVMFFRFELTCNFVIALQYNFKMVGESEFKHRLCFKSFVLPYYSSFSKMVVRIILFTEKI